METSAPTETGESVLRKLTEAYVARALAATPGAPAGLDALSNGADALSVLGAHGLTPLVGGLLSGQPAGDRIVPQVASALNEAWTRSLAVHRSAMRAIAEIAPRLREAGVPFALLKGPHVYLSLYNDEFPRPYGDIDLLVHRGDVERCVPLFAQCSYFPPPGGFDRWLALHAHFHLVLRRNPRGAPPIELHWSLVDRANLYRIDDGAVLDRSVDLSTAGLSLPVLSSEDLLIYLCLHAAKHGVLNGDGIRNGHPAEWFCNPATGNRLIWFLDIDLLLSRAMERLDWTAIRERIVRWNVGEDVATTLRVLQLVRPEAPAATVLEKLGMASSLNYRAHTGASQGRLDGSGMRMNKKLLFRPVRVRMLGGLLFPSPGRLRAYYGLRNAWALPLLYLIHPFHMARKLVR